MRIPANLFLMIGSVIIAVLLWLWVGAEERSEIVVNVPLQYRNLPKNYEIADKNIVTGVNVWVKGSTTAIKSLRPQDVLAWVDLQNAKPGAKNLELEQDHIRLPYGLSVLRVSPSRISLRIEQNVNRMVPVTVRFEGEPKLGYSVTQTNVVPPQVEIRGSQSAVATVRHVITDSIDISNITGSHVEFLNIGVENSAVRLGNTKTVRVSLTVSP